MRVRTSLKSGKIACHHNQTVVRGLTIRSGVKGGRCNRNQTVVRGR